MSDKLNFKKLLRSVDNILFSRFFRKNYASFNKKKAIQFHQGYLNYGFNIQYQKNSESLLNNLCDTYGSDKGEVDSVNNPYPWNSHNYADFYDLIFGLRRNDVKLVIECGIGTNNPLNNYYNMGINGKPGASLRVWRDFFPKAHIVGCDIDRDILFKEERITSYYCDQTSSESIEKFCREANIVENSVDIILDDGLHEFLAGKSFFENTISTLRTGGIYIIEDVCSSDIMKYKSYFFNLEKSYEVRFIYLKSPIREYGDDNNLICITKK